MSEQSCSHIDAITSIKRPNAAGMRGMREDRRGLGPFADLSGMRRDVVL